MDGGTRGVLSPALSPSSPMLRDCLLPVQPAGVLVEIGYIQYLACMPFPAGDLLSHIDVYNFPYRINYL